MHRSMFPASAGLRFAQKDSFNRPTRVQGAVRLFAIAQQALFGGFSIRSLVHNGANGPFFTRIGQP